MLVERVLGEPIEIPGIGQYVSFIDIEENQVSILYPTNMEMIYE